MDIDAKLVDAGEQCPCCGYLGPARPQVAMGISLFVCPECNEAWLDVRQEMVA